MKEKTDEEIVHHFILEMQNVYAPPFEDRMTYYVSKMITEQGKTGWNYDLDPVILIGITDFDFPYLSKQLVQEFELREKSTGESLTNKLRLMFYSLKQVAEKWEECKSELERRLFLIKNMETMDKNSKPYVEGGYEDLFGSAESKNVVGDEAVLYSRSLSYLREVQAGLDFRYEEGYDKGMEKGIESIARNMKEAGSDIEYISKITGLSPDKIESL